MTRLTFLISLLSPLAFWRKPPRFRCRSSLRNLGLTDREITQRALDSCSRWVACGQPPQFDFSEMFIKPETHRAMKAMREQAKIVYGWDDK